MKNKISSAAEFLKSNTTIDDEGYVQNHSVIIGIIMIEFAKLHVKAALEASYGDGSIECYCDSWESCQTKLNKSDIIDSYPEKNIK